MDGKQDICQSRMIIELRILSEQNRSQKGKKELDQKSNKRSEQLVVSCLQTFELLGELDATTRSLTVFLGKVFAYRVALWSVDAQLQEERREEVLRNPVYKLRVDGEGDVVDEALVRDLSVKIGRRVREWACCE